ncbi:ComEC family competence protein [Flavobacteriaceae bacterium F08102]|nr:ComEC family competence protein [Flavobacteriaceae bacterium F08102]
MYLPKYIPFQLALSLVLGIVLATIFPSGFNLNISILSGLVLTTLAFILLKPKLPNHPPLIMLSMLIIFGGIGYVRTNLSNPTLNPKHYNHFIKAENNLVLTLTEENKNRDEYSEYIAEIKSINNHTATGQIQVRILKDSTELKIGIGSQLRVYTPLIKIKPPSNPHQFNYQAFLHKKGIYHQILLTHKEVNTIGNTHHLLPKIAKFRKKIIQRLAVKGFKGDELAIINALLLGQRNDLSTELIKNYQNAGAIHILAVSGLHVGIILLLLNFLFAPIQKLPFGKTIKQLFVLSGIWLFALFVGMSPSIVRAATMFSALALSLSHKKRISTLQSLILSLFFLLLFNPHYLIDVGFQLSYTAVFFIVWLQPKIETLWKPPQKILSYFWQLVSVSMAAQLGVLPCSLYYFHQFPGLFFISNLVLIPFIGFLLISGIGIILLALLNSLPAFIVNLYSFLMSTMNAIISWIGHQDFFIFDHISFNLFALLTAYLIILTGVKWTETKKTNWLLFSLISLSIFQGNFLYTKYLNSESRLIIFNTYQQSLIAFQHGSQLHAYTTDFNSPHINRTLKEFTIGDYANLQRLDSLKNVYQLTNDLLLIVNNDGTYPRDSILNNTILLSQSPPVNLERLIKDIRPKQIIADASNYPTEVMLWEKTCKTYNIKFHYTVRDGAFLQQL